MMHNQEVLQRTHSISNILRHLKCASISMEECLTHHSSSILLIKSLFATAGRLDMGNSLNITRIDYKSGYCSFGFNTSPTLYHG